MKTLSNLITLLGLGASITPVSAGCFGGEEWPNDDINTASWHVERACNGYDGNQGAFQGEYLPGQIKHVCIQYSSTSQLVFEVQNQNSLETLSLNPKDCILRLQNEIKGCKSGGESTIAGWRFLADSNNAICP